MKAALTDIEMKVESVTFFSEADEKMFFSWLDGLPFVRRYEGRGRALHIFVYAEKMNEEALRELIALFYRHDLNMRQLRIFDRPEFNQWFHNKRAYWYESVFN